jgi:hypothetical protein
MIPNNLDQGRTDLLIFMSPDSRSLRRMSDDCRDNPKWFAYPIVHAGFDVHFRSAAYPIRQINHLLIQNNSLSFLVFTVSLPETVLSVIFHKKANICSLFQWIPLEEVPLYKRKSYEAVLSRSRVIVVYDQSSETYIRQRFPSSKILRMGLYVDTVFFSPIASKNNEPFLLCPGSHRRDEILIVRIAEKLDIPIVRFTQDPKTAEFYRNHAGSKVTLKYKITFQEMRQLYQDALAVINVVDDTQIPAGITCFCEALSMNKMIITPRGHSSSGYKFPDGIQPYLTINNPKNIDEWIERIKQVRSGELEILPNRSPRDLALLMCSKDASVKNWKEVKYLVEI